MSAAPVVLLTDHSSMEGSREHLATAAELLTGRAPVLLDARSFLAGGGGRIELISGAPPRLIAGADGRTVVPSAVIVYEIPPRERRRFEPFQHWLARSGVVSLGTDAHAWRAATDKARTAARFARDGIPHMPTVCLSRPTRRQARDAFDRLGRNVWARPRVGMGGDHVFHITSPTQLDHAIGHYAATGQDWLLSADANNLTRDGQRHQYRVVVLGDLVLRACRHVQPDPDAPCNESRGATSTLLDPDDLPGNLAPLAVAATRSLGLPFGGVDLVPEHGGVVFEVNVHPAFGTERPVDTVALPYVQAHLTPVGPAGG